MNQAVRDYLRYRNQRRPGETLASLMDRAYVEGLIIGAVMVILAVPLVWWLCR